MVEVQQFVGREAAEELLRQSGILLSDVSVARKNRILARLCQALQDRALRERLERQLES